MRALILNSGLGKRMGEETKNHPKCMTKIYDEETILSRQLKLLKKNGINDVVITTGPFEQDLIDYCQSLELELNIVFVNNPLYDKTNYIYSIYRARDNLLDDIILMHGDLVFSNEVLKSVISNNTSCVVISSSLSLPEKDFKAVVVNNKVSKIGIEFFDDAYSCQPLYKLEKKDWILWLNSINNYINQGKDNCYAENALNDVSIKLDLYPLDIENKLCGEIDNLEDLKIMRKRIMEEK